MTTKVYFNDNDQFVAKWLWNIFHDLCDAHVDNRSIRDVDPQDLLGYSQCHFFAGIGGWPYALELAGWPPHIPVWTGSCPCQPFSVAGRRKGTDDERHLWPRWLELIAHARPPIIFGEQVASPDGRDWLDNVQTDLEALDFEVGAADLCAAGIGAPHRRQRLFWVAIARGERRERLRLQLREWRSQSKMSEVARGGSPGSMGDPYFEGGGRNTGGVSQEEGDRQVWSVPNGAESSSAAGSVGNPGSSGFQGGPRGSGIHETQREAAKRASGPVGGFWADAEWLACKDGKARAVEPGTFPLAHGVPGRVGLIRAYGNAIVPQVAAAFIAATMDYLE